MAIFDRFIRYEWVEHALELAIQQQNPSSLQPWLLNQGLGKESARRTANLLTLLWFRPNSLMAPLRDKALSLFFSLSSDEHLVLHWGMAICQFPLFRETARVMGLLGRLQGEFTRHEIVQRIIEKYSNQSTVRRAVERIVQTLEDWKILQIQQDGRYELIYTQSIQSSTLAEWLLCTVMAENQEKYWLVTDLYRANEIFPFNLEMHSTLLYDSLSFVLERDSDGEEVVGLRGIEHFSFYKEISMRMPYSSLSFREFRHRKASEMRP